MIWSKENVSIAQMWKGNAEEEEKVSQVDGPTGALSWFLNIFQSEAPWGEFDYGGIVLYIVDLPKMLVYW